MSRLLLVEDEAQLARSMALALREEGYIVDWSVDGTEALALAGEGLHDLMVLDLRLPGLGGLEVCRRLRSAGSRLPILILSACDRPEDVIEGLDLGADDYLTKPFALAVLLARLRALLRRGSAGGSAQLEVEDLELDTRRRVARRFGADIALSALEFRVLEHLMRHRDEVCSRAEIQAAVWDDEIGPESNVLEVCISRLRRKLDREGATTLIHTRRGLGYLLGAVER